MKKIIIILVSLFCIFCSSCSNNKNDLSTNEIVSEDDNETIFGGYFTVIDEWSDSGETYQIVYDNNSKIKYFVSYYIFGFKKGALMVPLYNKDGSLQVYEG